MSTTLAVSTEEAASRLSLGTTTVKKLIRTGALPSVVIGRRRLVRVLDLEEFAASLPVTREPAG